MTVRDPDSQNHAIPGIPPGVVAFSSEPTQEASEKRHNAQGGTVKRRRGRKRVNLTWTVETITATDEPRHNEQAKAKSLLALLIARTITADLTRPHHPGNHEPGQSAQEISHGRTHEDR